MEILGRPFVLGLTLTLTVEAVKPLTSARGYKADRAPHDKKLRILARIQNFRHDSLIMKIICGFQYELYTTDEQRSALSRNAGCRRFVFNKALELQNERKKSGLSLLRYKELCLELVKWKKEKKTVFLKEAMSQPLQQALKDLDRAIADSFRPKSDSARKEWPKFKSKDIGDGFRIPQFKPEHIDDANGRVKLPKIGWMRYRKSRPLAFKCADGSMKSGTVRQIHIRKDCGHWFVVFTTEFDIEMPDPKELDVGIDLGVVHAVATSDGQFFDFNTGRIKELAKEIVRYQRKLALNRASRQKLAKAGRAEAFDKTKPSRKRRRLLEKLQKLHRRVRHIRRDFQMKTAHTLAQEYGCVYVEDLKTRNMTKSAKGTLENPGKNVKQKSGLNRAILRTGFFGMRQAIEWQQYKAGGHVVAVPAAYTSCECPSCTCTDKRNRPRQALFRCISCGYENNADIVGAINVRRKGRTGPSAHDKKRIAREVSAGASVPFARNSGANSENQPLGVAQATPKESSDFNQGRTSSKRPCVGLKAWTP